MNKLARAPRIAAVTAIVACIFAATRLSAQTPTTQSASTQAAGARPIYAQPQDVVAAVVQAARQGDLKTEVDCFSTTGQAAFMKLFMRFTLANHAAPALPDAQQKERAAFEAKYGLVHVQRKPEETDEQFAARLTDAVKDKRAFVLDLFTKNAKDKPNPPAAQPAPALENVTMADDGNSATGKLVRHDPDGSSMSMNVHFTKIDGSFLIDSIIFF